MKKVIVAAGAAYVLLCVMGMLLFTSCASTQGCGYAKAKKYNQKQMRKANRYRSYADNINNPENAEFVAEVAFNEGISSEDVTQEMFNSRYGIKN